MKYLLLFLSFGILSLNIACSDDDDDGSSSLCSKDDFSVTQTGITQSPATGSVIIMFDVSNDSSSDYDVSGMADASVFLHANIVVTTTDGTEYESKQTLNIFTLSAGGTSSQLATATLGADKEYASHTITLSCG